MTAALAVFVILALIGTPVALVMIGAGLAGVYTIGGHDLFSIVADHFYEGVAGFVLIAIPYFIFAAELMNRAQLTDRLIAFANSLFGRIPGALSHVNVVVSVFFAGLTGAAITDTVAIGKILIPAMKKEGYGADYCAAITACSSLIGPIIPPSIIMIVYGSTLREQASILGLFAAGLVPGLAMAAALLVASGFISWRRGYISHEAISLGRIVRSGIAALPALILPVLVLGAILSGYTTVTFAAAIGAVYALVLGIIVYRTLGVSAIWDSLVSTVRFSGIVFFLLGSSTILGWFVTRSGIAREASDLIVTVSTDPIIQIFAVNLLLIVLGMFIDVLPAIVVAAPVLAPALVQLGFDPLHIGIVMLLALNLGNITPPVGMTLMTAARISGVTYEAAIKESLPFLLSHLLILALASISPAFILWFPRLIGAVH